VTALRLESKEEEVRNALKKASHPVQIGDISNKDGSLSFMVSNPADVDAAREGDAAADQWRGAFGPARLGYQGGGHHRIVLTPTKAGIDQAFRRDEHGHRSGAQAYRRAGHA
jgi:preprotein translocase subunit SecD